MWLLQRLVIWMKKEKMLTDKFYTTSGNQALINSDRQLPEANSDCNSFLLINKNEPVITGNVCMQLYEQNIQSQKILQLFCSFYWFKVGKGDAMYL